MPIIVDSLHTRLLTRKFSVRKPRKSLDEVRAALETWPKFALQAGVGGVLTGSRGCGFSPRMKEREGFRTREVEHGFRADRPDLFRDRTSSDVAAIQEGNTVEQLKREIEEQIDATRE
jgi:hypothetical protein